MAQHREKPPRCGNTNGGKTIEQLCQAAQRKPRTTRPRSQDHCGNKRQLAIYRGRDCLGHVVDDGGRWEARSPNNKLIGTYASWIEAANAIAITASADVAS